MLKLLAWAVSPIATLLTMRMGERGATLSELQVQRLRDIGANEALMNDLHVRDAMERAKLTALLR